MAISFLVKTLSVGFCHNDNQSSSYRPLGICEYLHQLSDGGSKTIQAIPYSGAVHQHFPYRIFEIRDFFGCHNKRKVRLLGDNFCGKPLRFLAFTSSGWRITVGSALARTTDVNAIRAIKNRNMSNPI
jgi:hypothetical protein